MRLHKLSASWFRPRTAVLLLFGAVLAAAIGCGGDDEPVTIIQTVEVEVPGETVIQTVEVQVPGETITEKVVETVVVVATPTATAEVAMVPKSPSGSLTVATNSVGTPVGTPELCIPGCGNEKYLMGAWDTMTRAHPDGTTFGHIAESWEFNSDQTAITWHIRPGIEFHDN